MFLSQQKFIRLVFKKHFLKSFSRGKRELWVPVLLEVIVVMTVSSKSDTPQCP